MLQEILTGCEPEPTNQDYGATTARIGSVTVRYRVAKVTPKKNGHFVAVWRRSCDGGTEPFPGDVDVAALLVEVRDADGHGVFVFPRAALQKLGVSSMGGVGGKRGFRLYAPWVAVDSPQALRTQRQQGPYFVDLNGPDCGDTAATRSRFVTALAVP